MIDERLIEAVRAKYQYEMKKAVSSINRILKSPSSGDLEDIDLLLEDFKNAKDKGSYFEGILNTLKTNPEEENKKQVL
jgi:hypothetical protein